MIFDPFPSGFPSSDPEGDFFLQAQAWEDLLARLESHSGALPDWSLDGSEEAEAQYDRACRLAPAYLARWLVRAAVEEVIVGP
jgi:hypothetical protein